MRTLIVIMGIVLFGTIAIAAYLNERLSDCKEAANLVEFDHVKKDTVYINVPVLDFQTIDSLIRINDSLQEFNAIIQANNDTLAARLLHSRLVIANVKYYLNICMRNPSQDKFLKGWIRRAVE